MKNIFKSFNFEFPFELNVSRDSIRSITLDLKCFNQLFKHSFSSYYYGNTKIFFVIYTLKMGGEKKLKIFQCKKGDYFSTTSLFVFI